MATLQIAIDHDELARDIDAELARRNFFAFVRLVRPEFDVQWFHAHIIEEMQRAGTADENTRLGLAMPPGHAKSEYAILYCAWMVARDRDITIKYVTYNQEFAEDQFDRLKKILELDVYVDHFGQAINSRRVVTDTRLGKKNSRKMVELVGGSGWVQACGFGGGITGGRCDVIVVDDPFKNHEEAYSPTTRAKRWNEYGSAIKTRKRMGRPLRILMLFTRWHLDDLVGRCRDREPEDWRWVEYAALREEREDPTGRDPRRPGEALWPDVTTAADLEKERIQRPGVFHALYQQRPVPAGGATFKAAWFAESRYRVLPDAPGRWIQSWDCRHGGKGKRTSYAAAGLWFNPKGTARYYLVDVVRGRWSPSETVEQFKSCQKRPLWAKASVRLIEAKGDGQTLLSVFSGKFPGILPVKPRSDKEERANSITPYCHAGNVWLPVDAPWLGEFEAELFTFPAAANDDQVDMMSQAVDHMTQVTTLPKIKAKAHRRS